MKSFFFCWNFLPHLNPLEIRRNPIRYRRGDPESALRWNGLSICQIRDNKLRHPGKSAIRFDCVTGFWLFEVEHDWHVISCSQLFTQMI